MQPGNIKKKCYFKRNIKPFCHFLNLAPKFKVFFLIFFQYGPQDLIILWVSCGLRVSLSLRPLIWMAPLRTWINCGFVLKNSDSSRHRLVRFSVSLTTSDVIVSRSNFCIKSGRHSSESSVVSNLLTVKNSYNYNGCNKFNVIKNSPLERIHCYNKFKVITITIITITVISK